jgi:hypothetical protein
MWRLCLRLVQRHCISKRRPWLLPTQGRVQGVPTHPLHTARNSSLSLSLNHNRSSSQGCLPLLQPPFVRSSRRVSSSSSQLLR